MDEKQRKRGYLHTSERGGEKTTQKKSKKEQKRGKATSLIIGLIPSTKLL